MIEFSTNQDSPFNNTLVSFTKVLVMTSEIDYDDIFKTKSNVSELWEYVARIILVSFVILITIVLTNLMVGVAVNDIKLLEAHGKTRRLAKQVHNSIISFVTFHNGFSRSKYSTTCSEQLQCTEQLLISKDFK